MQYGLREILEVGAKGHFAVPAFNVYNLETVMGVRRAALESGAPVIFQVYSRLFDSENGQLLAPAILEAIHSLPTPAAFHLDHGAGIPEVCRALRAGATGIMIDGSAKPFEENIAITKEAMALCAASRVTMEGELGHVGTTKDEVWAEHTRVDEAVEFAERTGISALAVMVGTAHGRYKKAPKLNIDRIREIRKATGLPLVLHGGSGVPDDQVKAAIEAGICKVNFGTDLCYSFLDGVRAVESSIVAVDLFMREPVECVKRFALEKIALLGAGA